MLIAPTASRLASLTADETGTRTFLARVALALLRNGRERPRGGGERVFVAVFAAIIVALDAVCSFAVVAQSLACDAFASAMVSRRRCSRCPSRRCSARRPRPIARGRPAAARTLRAYAEWTMASSVAVGVAFFADATDAIGIDVFGGERARALVVGGRAWFVAAAAGGAVVGGGGEGGFGARGGSGSPSRGGRDGSETGEGVHGARTDGRSSMVILAMRLGLNTNV